MEKRSHQRLGKELVLFQKDKLKYESDLYFDLCPTNINQLYAVVFGPKDTPYEGGIFYFTIDCSKDYPAAPPHFHFENPGPEWKDRIHPNLYENGKVCLSILGTTPNGTEQERWTPAFRITTILLSIRVLMDNNPINHMPREPFERMKVTDPEAESYAIMVRWYTLRSTLRILRNETHPLRSVLIEFYLKQKDVLQSSISKLEPHHNKIISNIFGRTMIDYHLVKKEYTDFDQYMERYQHNMEEQSEEPCPKRIKLDS